ncbi:hypothetical protein [Bombella mellum]|uniref:Uncharacterized protein n=1 Tax=Bombella mellum TaxID=2039288 RepID=A0ABR5ZRI7_9PROT|nr:hypothetical protein [Bombella mellum]MBA5726941.1 hypothetical protein [Bombella mellum]
MSTISDQIARQKRPTDNGLLERVEGDRHPSSLTLLALISRTADILEKNDTLNERAEDETWIAFDALDKLRGQLSTILYEDEAGMTAHDLREDAVRNHHDCTRKSEAA